MGAPPGQLAEYRREVLELHALIQGFRQDVAELKQQQRQQQAFPPSSPSIQSAIGSVTGSESEETTLADASDTVLRLTWLANPHPHPHPNPNPNPNPSPNPNPNPHPNSHPNPNLNPNPNPNLGTRRRWSG